VINIKALMYPNSGCGGGSGGFIQNGSTPGGVSGDTLRADAVCAGDADRAAKIAPVLRMCYAKAREVNGLPMQAGAAAPTVAYLGDVNAADGNDFCMVKHGEEGNYKLVTDRLREKTKVDVNAVVAVVAEGVGMFVCAGDIQKALRTIKQVLPDWDARYDGKHIESLKFMERNALNRNAINRVADNRSAENSAINRGADDRGAENSAINRGAYDRGAENRCVETRSTAESYAAEPGSAGLGVAGNGASAPASATPDFGRLDGKIALITGGAQGFGRGIALELAARGAYIAAADINYDGAAGCAAEINRLYGAGRAIAVRADVTDENSVEAMVRDTVLSYGGLDLFISNAGILIAGALQETSKKSFELVTSVNYTGYFLGVKHASVPMKIQRSVDNNYTADIIEMNSKSGLEGSNKNFAYAGSKFGGIGLTQSFALELVDYNIKVNAICPGNFLNGPLWSDPEKGLFVQYLKAGKVPGAKTVDDVRKFYENKVPLKRGCEIKDIARAIFYIVEQEYETGQAVPVTGGQEMLK